MSAPDLIPEFEAEVWLRDALRQIQTDALLDELIAAIRQGGTAPELHHLFSKRAESDMRVY